MMDLSNSSINKENEDMSFKLWIVLSRAARSVSDKVQDDIRTRGLNTTEFAVLELLYHKGEQQIQHIGKKILLSSGSMTYVVDKLTEKGLIRRKACTEDRRVSFAVITDKGMTFMNEVFPKHKKAIQQLLDILDDNEKEVLIQLLKKVGHFADRQSL